MSQSRTRVRSVTVRKRTPLAQVPDADRHTAMPPEQTPNEHESSVSPLSFGERMLRNTAICVAMLLCVLAVQSVGTPGASNATSVLSQIVSMDLSESLGSLRFVSNLLPETANVFWNLGVEKHSIPSDGEVVHTFSAQEPWLGFNAGAARSSAAGEVMSVSVDAVGASTIRIRHASGMETIYGNLREVTVREGDWVEAQDVLGVSDALVYELRGEGRSMDPSPYLE